MIRWGFLIIAVIGAPAGASTVFVSGSGYARGCFEAASNEGSARDPMRLCNKAVADDRLPAGDRAATLINRGIVQMQKQKLTGAIADFDEAIRLQPGSAEAYINKGVAVFRLGRNDEALALLSEGIARGPLRPAIAYYQRAVANEELGRVREAYEDYSRAAELAPEWADPAEQLQRFRTVRRKTLQG